MVIGWGRGHEYESSRASSTVHAMYVLYCRQVSPPEFEASRLGLEFEAKVAWAFRKGRKWT